MSKVFFAGILVLSLIRVDPVFAQGATGGVKIYSGYLHHDDVNSMASLWHAFLGAKPDRQKEVDRDRQCSIEFKSPVSFSHQSVVEIPKQLTYSVSFKNGLQSSQADDGKEKGAFEKFIIKIYTNDDEEYSIDPGADGKGGGINQEHPIFDTYLIYLILGQNISHMEIVGASGSDQDKYVLDKVEVHDNH